MPVVVNLGNVIERINALLKCQIRVSNFPFDALTHVWQIKCSLGPQTKSSETTGLDDYSCYLGLYKHIFPPPIIHIRTLSSFIIGNFSGTRVWRIHRSCRRVHSSTEKRTHFKRIIEYILSFFVLSHLTTLYHLTLAWRCWLKQKEASVRLGIVWEENEGCPAYEAGVPVRPLLRCLT
jgi:hypothetical protein